MNVYQVKDMESIRPLFNGWKETLIYSCLDGSMGRAYTDNLENPESAQIIIADLCFFAGKVKESLIKHKPKDRISTFIIMTAREEEWKKAIQDYYKENAKKVTRYAIKKEPDVFDQEKLQEIVDRGSKQFELKLIDEECYNQIKGMPWAVDWCSSFKSYSDYKSRGIGVVAIKDGKIVSGASSYTVYNGGIEIQIDTEPTYRRKGLALACGARLILECLKKGIYPSWDAQNKGSVALAEKLGYHVDFEYDAFEIVNFV